ncbi:MAG: carbamate kinase [Desulfurococcaceae archaeon]
MFTGEKGLIVIALGGNAFQSKEDRGLPNDYWRNAEKTANLVAELVKERYRVIVTHGNGPQVGIIEEWMVLGLKQRNIPPMTLDIAGAMTQGWLGYILQQSIHNKLREKGLLPNVVKGVVTIITQTLVDINDIAFKNPSKYIGSWYEREEAEIMSKELGWVFKEDPRGGYRRVVPSPEPIELVEINAIKTLLDNGFIVIASGGGGIPVYINETGGLKGVEAVIDKDLSAERLATALKADLLLILTDIESVYLNYGKPDAKPINTMTVEDALKYYNEGHFKPGSMGPKIMAAIRFAKNSGKIAIIAHLNKALEALRGLSGTRIIP